MRVVILSTHCPYPPTSGGRIRFAALVSALAARHEVRLFLLTDESDRNLEHVRAGGVAVTVVQRSAWDRLSVRRRALHNLSALLRGTTPVFEAVSDRRTDADICQEAARADVFVVDTTSLAPYATSVRRAAPHVKVLINTHDVDSTLFRRLADASPNVIGKVHKRLLAANAERLERSFHRNADAVLAVSDEDRGTIEKLNRNAVPVYVVPNAVDTDELLPLAPTRNRTIIFCGVLNYQPNVEGIRWFVDRVLPLVQAQVPDVRLLLVGRRPAAEISAYASRDGIQVTGEVEDVREFYAVSAVAIAPLLTGGGTRLKILEAMALGRVVVSTTRGAEGLSRASGLIIADDPVVFADSVTSLLTRGVSIDLIQSNLRFVESFHSWHSVGALLDDVLAKLIAPRNSTTLLPL